MSIALVALVGIVLLIGLVALGLGTQGWSWGTVAAAFLALVSAAAFVFLVGRVAERERAWRDKVRKLQADLERTRDAMAPGPGGGLKAISGERSLTGLKDELERWKRARERADTWRGRMWENASFRPPRVGNEGDQAAAGMLLLDVPSDEAEKPPFNPGAQVFIFDDTPAEDGGRFLGAFRITTAAKDGEQFRFEAVPATTFTEADTKFWSKQYDAVTVFERLPADTWLAFSRTQQPQADGEEPAEEADSIVPPIRKQSAEKMLEKLEARLAQIEKHESPVPEDEWKKLVADKNVEPGRYWATVEFTAPFSMPKDGREKEAERPKEAAEEEEEKETFQFEKGDTAEFLLETAVDLGEKNVAEIKQVVYRRPLVDAGLALEGGEMPGVVDARLRTLGLIARRNAVTQQKKQIEAETKKLSLGTTQLEETIKAVQSEEQELVADLDRWKRDVEAATEVAATFDERLTAATRAVREAWDAVVQLGREYDGSVALLQADIDKRAPAPR